MSDELSQIAAEPDVDDDEELGPEFDFESLEELSEQNVEDTSWAEELIGQTFGGRYLIEQELARGGMGIVYLGRQTNLNRRVVVKVISKYFVDGPDDLDRFEQEAMGLSALQHPNIVTIYDFGAESGLSYIAMEHIEGETLEARLARSESLTLAEFARIAPQILRAIGTAHDQGIIHRDIKPANVMLTRRNHQDDFVKVVDFGLVKLLGSGREITGKGLVGTFAYVSPEQILGEPFDARSDVYALGILFYHMLAGRKPFDDPDGMSILYKHVHDTAAPLEKVERRDEPIPAALAKIVHQCLEKDPARRPRNATEVLDLLVRRGIVSAEDSSGPGVTGERIRSDASDSVEFERQRRSLVMPLTFVLAVLVLVMLLTRSDNRESAQPVREKQVLKAAPEPRTSAQYIEEAERLAEAGKWSQASILLRRADEAPGGNSELLARSVELENRIAIGELWSEADRHSTKGEPELAVQRLEEALRRDPDNATTLDRLTELRPAAPEEIAVEELALAEPETRVAKKAKQKRAPANQKKKASSSVKKAEASAERATTGKVASPRLPNQIRVKNRRMLEQLLRRVESEATDRNDFRPLDVQNSTRLLFKAAAADIEANKEPTVSARKIYYVIANGVKAGRDRDTIAKDLEKAYRAGSLD